jgi:hypothetical protein
VQPGHADEGDGRQQQPDHDHRQRMLAGGIGHPAQEGLPES